jgi:hypothetical protein
VAEHESYHAQMDEGFREVLLVSVFFGQAPNELPKREAHAAQQPLSSMNLYMLDAEILFLSLSLIWPTSQTWSQS